MSSLLFCAISPQIIGEPSPACPLLRKTPRYSSISSAYILKFGKTINPLGAAGLLIIFSASGLAQLIAHVVLKLTLHITALIIFFHPAINAPKEQRPNPKANGIQQEGCFGIQGTHKRTGRNKTGKYQIDKRFHYSKMIGFPC